MFKPQQCALLVSLACAGQAYAANVPEFAGDPVVVTATRQPQEISKTLSDVSVITREQIEQSAATSLPQLLSRQGGLEIVSTGARGAPSSIFMRGANSNQTVVLVDGVRIVSATTGVSAVENIPLEQIEKVEILRGSGSSLYGADAIGGVIQIFTREGKGSPKLNASFGIGDHGLVKVGAGVSGKVENTAFSLNLNHEINEGISATNRDSSNYNPDRDPYRNLSYSANVTQTLLPGHDLTVRAFQTFSKFDYDQSLVGEDLQKSRQNGFTIQSKNALMEHWASTLRFSHTVDRQETWIGSDMVNRDSLIETRQNEWFWQNDIKTSIGTFLAGAVHTQQNVDGKSTYLPNGYSVTQRTNNAGFIGYSGEFGHHLVQANLRNDKDSQFGGKTTGQLAYGYRLSDELTARASYGTAYKAPTFNDLYWPNYGNPLLQPETSRNIELGLKWLGKGRRLELSLFDNRIENLIVYQQKQSLNRDAHIRGVTLSGAATYGSWDLAGSATYQDPIDESSHLQLQRRARAFAQMSAAYDWGKAITGLEWQASAKRPDVDYRPFPSAPVTLGGYSLTNLFANYRLAKEWTATMRLSNIFEKRYTTAYGYNTSGLGGYIGVTYQAQ